ncbi:phage tail tube protein [Micromonospora aurantiaca]|uniref:phage tail tube protein n=1 Tax=Micromonospora aurantiaca (nom. illeg.) TaxID=47850 RepID=UPI0033A90615
MPKMVLKAAYVSLNGTDLSSYTSKIELKTEVEEQDVTTFASAGWTELIGGLASGELSLGFKQDVAASALDATMWPLFGTVVPFEVRLTNSAVGTSNPKYTGNVLIKEWTPIAGSVGDVAEMDVSYPTSGAVGRATA